MTSSRSFKPAVFNSRQHLANGDPAETGGHLAQDLNQERIAEVHEHRLYIFMEIQPLWKATANKRCFRQSILHAEFAERGKRLISTGFCCLTQFIVWLQCPGFPLHDGPAHLQPWAMVSFAVQLHPMRV